MRDRAGRMCLKSKPRGERRRHALRTGLRGRRGSAVSRRERARRMRAALAAAKTLGGGVSLSKSGGGVKQDQSGGGF